MTRGLILTLAVLSLGLAAGSASAAESGWKTELRWVGGSKYRRVVHVREATSAPYTDRIVSRSGYRVRHPVNH